MFSYLRNVPTFSFIHAEKESHYTVYIYDPEETLPVPLYVQFAFFSTPPISAPFLSSSAIRFILSESNRGRMRKLGQVPMANIYRTLNEPCIAVCTEVEMQYNAFNQPKRSHLPHLERSAASFNPQVVPRFTPGTKRETLPLSQQVPRRWRCRTPRTRKRKKTKKIKKT